MLADRIDYEFIDNEDLYFPKYRFDIPELRLITLHRIGKIKKAVYVRTPQAGAEGIFA
jgi:hypothetical protein